MRWLALLAIVLWGTSMPASADSVHWRSTAETVIAALGKVEASFARGDKEQARKELGEAYIDRFELSKFEAAIRVERGVKRAAELERTFARIHGAIASGDAGRVKAFIAELTQALTAEAAVLDAANIPPTVFRVNE